MLTFTNPSVLPLLGLLVPLAIHLWNRRPGREVAVGSLRWLATGANRRLRNLRLEQLWLLLLRAALLAALAGVVAGPAWRHVQPAGRGQVLISRELADGSSLAAVRPTIDSLRRRGYQLRWLAAGLPPLSAAEWQRDSLGHPALPASSSLSATLYWARMQEAAGAFAGQPLYALTPAALRGFGGPHPALPTNLTWKMLPARAAANWLQAASASPDSLRLLLGHSDAKQTTFRTVRVALPRPGASVAVAGLPPLRYEATASGSRLRPIVADPGRGPEAVPVAAGPLRVHLYATAGYADDVRYLRAALRAAATGLGRSLTLTLSPTPPEPSQAIDWLFWLSDSPVPATWRARVPRGLHLWQEATGPGVADTTTLATAETTGAAPVYIVRRAELQPLAGSTTRWADGQGRAVLTEALQAPGATYRLATRLNPVWSSLADSPELPALLLSLLAPETRLGTDSTLTAHDQRQLDPVQLPTQPERQASRAVAPPVAYRFTDVRPWLVLLAAILFGLERWLAQRRFTSSTSISA